MPAVFDTYKHRAVLQAIRHADGKRMATPELCNLIQGLGDAFNIYLVPGSNLKPTNQLKGAARELTACSVLVAAKTLKNHVSAQ